MIDHVRSLGTSTLIIGMVTSFLYGCGGVQLYDQARDQTAQAAKSNWNEANISEALNVERDNLNFLLEQEKQLMARHTQALRDQEYFTLVTDQKISLGKWWLEGSVKQRLNNLGFIEESGQSITETNNQITTFVNRD